MATREISKENWVVFFELLSKAAVGRQILLELIGQEIGDQIEKDWSLSEGLSFDPDAGTLYIQTPQLEHAIYNPQKVIVQEDGSIRTLGVTDAEGHLQLVHFRDPLLIEGLI